MSTTLHDLLYASSVRRCFCFTHNHPIPRVHCVTITCHSTQETDECRGLPELFECLYNLRGGLELKHVVADLGAGLNVICIPVAPSLLSARHGTAEHGAARQSKAAWRRTTTLVRDRGSA